MWDSIPDWLQLTFFLIGIVIPSGVVWWVVFSGRQPCRRRADVVRYFTNSTRLPPRERVWPDSERIHHRQRCKARLMRIKNHR